MYFETSAKDGKNIDECFYFISEKLMKQYDSNKEKEKEKRNDLINNESLKQNAVVLIGDKKKCCV